MKIEICECVCHKNGKNIRHFMPCCNMCGQKYINEDGTFDWVAVGEAIRACGVRGDYSDNKKE